MKCLVKNEPAVGLTLKEKEKPSPKDNEILIKVKKAAICGTDLHLWNWDSWAQEKIKPPMTVGHEFMGVIEEVGKKIKNFKIGDRVSVESHITGTKSRNARAGKLHLDPDTVNLGVDTDGAFAEYVKVPESNVVPLPDSVSDEVGAILDPFGNAVHATLSFDLVGEDVLITGAGPIGIMCSAELLNPTNSSISEKMKDMGLKEGFDIGLEMSGSEFALRDMVDNMIMGGKVALLGIPSKEIKIDLNKIIFKALNLKAIYGREIYETWYKGLALIDSGLKIEEIITHRFKFEDYKKAFDLLNEGKAGKVILSWD